MLAYGRRVNPTTGVLSEGWELYRRHLAHFAVIAFVVYAVISLITLVAGQLFEWLGLILAALVGIVGSFWLQGALVRAVDDIRDGRADLSVGQTFASVRDKVAPVAGAGLLAGIAIAIGFILLIVPGLFLLTIWIAIVPAIVLENRGVFDAFGRSQNLVRRYGMSVFGVIALTILAMIVVGIVLGLVLLPLPATLERFATDVISGTLVAPFVTVVWTLLYFRLRAAKESPPDAPPATWE